MLNYYNNICVKTKMLKIQVQLECFWITRWEATEFWKSLNVKQWW